MITYLKQAQTTILVLLLLLLLAYAIKTHSWITNQAIAASSADEAETDHRSAW